MNTLAEVARQHIIRTLELCDNNVVKAAEQLNVDRRTLYRRLEKWGVKLRDVGITTPEIMNFAIRVNDVIVDACPSLSEAEELSKSHVARHGETVTITAQFHGETAA